MRKLWVRLTGAFLLVALVAVAVVALVIGQSVERGFRGYLGRESSQIASAQLVEELETYYARQGGWRGVEAVLPAPGGQRGGGQRAGAGRHGMGGGMMMGSGARFVLYDAAGSFVAGSDPDRNRQDATQADLENAVPLQVDGEVVGWLLVTQQAMMQSVLSATQTEFLEQVRRTLLLAALLAGGVALVAGIAISRVLARPLRRLTGAAQAVAAGQLGRQVDIYRDTAQEIHLLAKAFNHMSSALERAEHQRRQLTADIAHELRTPLSVMRGQLQAMLDGLYPTDATHVAVVYEQTLHLERVVDDLHTLTRAETGHLPLRMQRVDPSGLVRRAAALFEPLAQDAGLVLRVEAGDGLPPVRGDVDRLNQVLANLLSNALRHTDAGGTIRLTAEQTGDNVRLSVTNTGAALTPEQAEHVFDRFWRADESRQRDRGGAGLGLAIAKEIVNLHGGRIWVEVVEGETRFAFELPPDRPSGCGDTARRSSGLDHLA